MGGETPRGDDILALSRQAKALGLDSVWLVDHFFWHVPDVTRYGDPLTEEEEGVKIGFWECWCLAAQHAQHWNCWLTDAESSVDAYRAARQGMLDACDKYGRDPATLVKNAAVAVCLPGHESRYSTASPIVGTEQAIAQQLGAFLEQDPDPLVVSLQPCTASGLDTFARVLARLHA